jgi:hypothetical protein
MKKLLQIITVIIIVVGIIMLAFSYVATVVYADDGYPAPIDYGYPVGYPIYIGYPVDVGYPVYDHYPVTGYSEPLPGYPIEIGYQVYTPMPMQDYPEPGASSPELVSNPVQLEPILPQYVNGRNLWQEIVYQFSRLLELMK